MQDNKDELYKSLAKQLRHPDGIIGKEVAEKMNKGNRLMNLDTIKQLNIANNDHILEIGMGNGFFVNDIISSANNVKYYGCDTSPDMVEQAVALNTKWVNSKHASFIAGDAHQLPYDDRLFQKIFTVNTLYFWEDATRVFKELKRTLTDDGLLIVTIRPKAVMEKMPIAKFGFKLFSKEDAVQELAANGFTVTNIIEKGDEDVRFQEMVIKNAYLVITAIKSK